MATVIPLEKYIPAGCLHVAAEDLVPDGVRHAWPLPPPPDQDGDWLLSYHPDDAPAPVTGTHLDALFQSVLVKLPALAPLARLFRNRWARFSFRVSSRHADHGFCRVYVLPDDECRRLVARSDPRLRRDLQTLLAGLDASADTWRYGEYDGDRPPLSLRAARQGGSSGDDDDDNGDEAPSLLHMFNTIPSPQPQPDLIQDPAYVQVMDALATSTVPGLQSTLYRYQVRSATVMLQRELCPGRIVDPRLLCVPDAASGHPWYYDDVTGEVLRAPRWYDGATGGILAEEMGTGKTLICLALILATRAFPAEMPEVCREVSFDDGDGNVRIGNGVRRSRIGSLADMAAAVATRHSVPWKLYFGEDASGDDDGGDGSDGEYRACVRVIKRNRASYALPRFLFRTREACRTPSKSPGSQQQPAETLEQQQAGPRIFLSHCSLVIVPANLVRQWEQEISKHTRGLRVLVVTGKQLIPRLEDILEADILLFSLSRFEKLEKSRVVTRSGWDFVSPLAFVHFKRVIVDEGHHLGNSKMGRKSNLLLILDCLQISARWIVTGTPSTGLFGVDDSSAASTPIPTVAPSPITTPTRGGVEGDLLGSGSSGGSGGGATMSASFKAMAASSSLQEKKDLERIGAMASLYLRVRPWANTPLEYGSGGDTLADWAVYVMQPRHSNRSSGRRDCLRTTLDALIVRHRKAEVGDLLPPVVERVVLLDGSYQDRLCLNLFAMMILFNAVQSQRTDKDYFFHPSQRHAVLQLLSNMRQSTFFGAYFFSAAEIAKALETAEAFVADGKVAVSDEDAALLQDAIAFGHMALKNRFKQLAHAFHEVPVYVKDFPGGGRLAAAWSLDGRGAEAAAAAEGSPPQQLTCTAAPMIRSLQQFLRPCMDAPHSLQAMFDDGRFAAKGRETVQQHQEKRHEPTAAPTAAGSRAKQGQPLAGNTGMGGSEGASSGSGVGIGSGGGSSAKKRSRDSAMGTPARMEALPLAGEVAEEDIAAPLARAQLVSTASAKLSYLLDAIVRHQADEQILVFYDNENVAFYLAEHLEILQIHHLIYARGITAARRAQYVATFNGGAGAETGAGAGTAAPEANKFRVLLMDLSQAAFGLDMRSASRIYFVSPVLNPQVEAQAIGRARRISQKRQVTVEILVLRDSLDEVIVARRQTMTQAEHRKMKSLLDDQPIYEWMVHARILPLPPTGRADGADGAEDMDGPAQMAPLQTPQFLFGRGFGRVEHPDEGLVAVEQETSQGRSPGPETAGQQQPSLAVKRRVADTSGEGAKPKKVRVQVRFADVPAE